jgi:CubicO group peptidase (beta-lactamase class C family)
MPGRSARRPLLWAAASGLLIVLAGIGGVGWRLISILVNYKAKQVCSGVFVSGRDAAAVETDLAIDDLAALRYVDADVDRRRGAVTASALGVTAHALRRGTSGCAIVDTFDEARTDPDVSSAAAPSHRLYVSASPGTSDEPRDERLERVIDTAFAEPDAARLRRTRAVVVVHRGRVVGERYAGDVTASTPLLGWSMTKSVVNALIGILVRQGRLALDRPVPIPEWQRAGDPRGAITLDHLLRMSSGLRFDEDAVGPFSDVIRMLLRERDMAAFAVNQPLEAPPGTRWQYSSGTTVILSRVMRNAIGDDAAYHSFPREALFEPAGMTRTLIETDAAGTFVGSSLMFATARDWARLGTLYLDDGVIDGKRLWPDGWVTYTTTPASADASKGFGAHVWLDVPAGYNPSKAPLPDDAFHAAGHQGQFVTIVPSREAVIVRLGNTRYRDTWDHGAFVRDVLAALP